MKDTAVDESILDLLIVGGGASGLAAAIAFQKYYSEVTGEKAGVLILEKNDRVGKKILASGNGRCNLSNQDMKINHFHSQNRNFPQAVLDRITPTFILSFLEDLGIPTVNEGQKIFPMSKTSSSVVDAFRFALDDYDIHVEYETSVAFIQREEKSFRVTCTDSSSYLARFVIVACGGACAPTLGTTGDGYRWLHDLGHKVYAPKPSIVQIVTDNSVTKALSGLKLDADVSLSSNDMLLAHQYGEVLFTDYGLSGPAVLQISGVVSRYTVKKQLTVPMTISLKLFDEMELQKIREEIGQRISIFGQRTLDQLLLGILPGKIGNMLLKTALQRPLSILISTLSNEDIEKVVRTLKAWKFTVLGTKSLEHAQTTIGGADTSEFSFETMQSNLVPGLYACGEVLDVDGDCGGYNLTWAFSSGILAGRSVAIEAGSQDAD